MMLFTVGFVTGIALATVIAVVVLGKLSERFDLVEEKLRSRDDLINEAIAEIKRKDIENFELRSDIRQLEAVAAVARTLNHR